MKVEKIIALAALVCSFVLSVDAVAGDPPSGFRNGKWGSVPAASLKKYSGPTSDGTTIYVPKAEGKPAPFLNIPVGEELYSFTNGKLYMGSVFLDGRENFDAMKTALVGLFGQPSFTNERTELYKWKWPNTQIEVHLYYQAKFLRTTVTYINNAI